MNRERILIVEDEVITMTVLAEALKAQGYQVFSAINGTQAMQSFQTVTPDLMILDLRLEDDDPFANSWDGFGVLGWVRRNSPDTPIPVIIHTASDSPSLTTRAKAGGAFAVVQKSSPIGELLGVVRAALNASGLQRAAGQ
jgi:two-component system OmpR family response regulator